LQVALGTALTLTSSVVSRSSRMKLFGVARELGFRQGVGPDPLVPAVPEQVVAPDQTPIVVREAAARDGNVTVQELVVLNRLVASRRPQLIFEIGTFDFRTTINLAANSPADARVFTLDLPPEGPVAVLPLAEHDPKYIGYGARHARVPDPAEAERITALHGDSATFDFAPYRGRMDLVFVDGAHSYEYVLRDSETALSLAAPGAAIVWHDYDSWPGVTAALNELFLADKRFAGLRRVSGTTLAVLDLRPA
jgi:predicted O-methyltransferase YrrM